MKCIFGKDPICYEVHYRLVKIKSFSESKMFFVCISTCRHSKLNQELREKKNFFIHSSKPLNHSVLGDKEMLTFD